MPKRPARKNRNYREEYDKYQGSSEQKKKRAKRNKVRREANRKGRCKLGDIAHKDNNPNNNSSSNLSCQSKSANRSFKRNKKGGHA